MNQLSRYWALWRAAVAAEKARTTGRLAAAEPDFLPAALEVIEKPVSPTGRITAWILLSGLALTLLWAVLGRVDIVATAEGSIVPTDSIKLVQSSEGGVVRRIHVHEGARVRRGQPLIDLDPTVTGAEESQAIQALLAARIEAARDKAIADALSGQPLRFDAPEGTPPEVAETQRRLIAAQLAQTQAAIAGFAAARQSSLADALSADRQVRKYGATMPVLNKEIDAMNGLAAKGYAPGLRLMELERQRHAELGERDVARAQQSRALSDARKFGQQAAQSREEARLHALAELAKAQTDVGLRAEELRKAHEKARMQRLVAPVDGTVQQLAIHTVGGVVEPAKPLMVVVPDGAVTVEAKVLNRDAGFVRVGQSVAVKLQAFPFTQYGTIPGHIVSISGDAIPDKDVGPYFLARIALERRSIMTENGKVALTSGLATTNDIGIGTRSIISYLVRPVEEIRKEAARER
ncbi:HlyD family type I secretion periplasmic adaptor subunit [Novosphingobium kaempferiae]|uniref:HlyD family type I secretion periplasmic adaptor subunit n=1 Tax=Novosphingobium kaempferiae TaxID=2896849 RepID=UPI001E295908|nr:HlyD family type I secretion periplasmic adaptor subunit [Novosphingobium kaempferiae]